MPTQSDSLIFRRPAGHAAILVKKEMSEFMSGIETATFCATKRIQHMACLVSKLNRRLPGLYFPRGKTPSRLWSEAESCWRRVSLRVPIPDEVPALMIQDHVVEGREFCSQGDQSERQPNPK